MAQRLCLGGGETFSYHEDEGAGGGGIDGTMESDVRAYDDGWSSHLVSAARRTCAQAGACWRLGERLAGIQVGLEAALACAAAGDVIIYF